MNIAIEYIEDYGKPVLAEKVKNSAFYNFILLLEKGNFLDNLVAYFKAKLFKTLYNKWDKLIGSLEAMESITHRLTKEELQEFQQAIDDAIHRTIDLNESIEKVNFSDDEYRIRYKAILKRFNATNNSIHKIITKDNPIQKTPQSLKEGLSNLGMGSISKTISA